MDSKILPYTQYFTSDVDIASIQTPMSELLANNGYTLAALNKVGDNHYSFEITYDDKSWRTWKKVYKEKNVDCVYDAKTFMPDPEFLFPASQYTLQHNLKRPWFRPLSDRQQSLQSL